jgi:hypothetical protein
MRAGYSASGGGAAVPQPHANDGSAIAQCDNQRSRRGLRGTARLSGVRIFRRLTCRTPDQLDEHRVTPQLFPKLFLHELELLG